MTGLSRAVEMTVLPRCLLLQLIVWPWPGAKPAYRKRAQVNWRRAVDDPRGKRFAQCRGNGQARDVAATRKVEATNCRRWPDNVLPVGSHRWQPTAMLTHRCLEKDGELSLDVSTVAPEQPGIKRQILDVEVGVEVIHVEERRVVLVDPPQKTTITGPHIDGSVHDPDHRQVCPGVGHRLGDEQLLRCRDKRNTNSAGFGHLSCPGAGGIDDNRGMHATARGVDTRGLAIFDQDARDRSLRQYLYTVRLRRTSKADG